MQVVDHIPQDISPACPTCSSPQCPTEKTPLLSGLSNGSHLCSKAHPTRGWNTTSQNRIRGKGPTNHQKKASTYRPLPCPDEWVNDLESSQYQRNSCQVSPAQRPSPMAVNSLGNMSDTTKEPSPKGTLSPEPYTLLSPSDWVSLRLQNSGSVARDHLASERTFLAYVRTSLTIVSAGVGKR